ncbi:3-dehydroquinate synthase [Panacibacter sp. DH6]|uniref:3-dehydroquinate synthase n=1 Tax=Panacibacter microcysteis TaxID=2793269 RepID=A0A931E6K1_9BACT|nr:3-dehydroquinate synthase [Panacibacter microcysteis]MBG9374671.1 3-dehydroquinate synthase [Panacibacter microcysteis]
MTKKVIQYSSASTVCYFDASFDHLEKLTPKENTFIITDENVYNAGKRRFKGWKTIVVKPGEAHKTQATVDHIIGQLVEAGANRKSWIVGVGGGVITDMAGYVAGIYMRGVQFGFVPASILAMVDAAIGGKNGVDVGVYKNMVGLIRQPSFLLYDYTLLKSLPREEWINGFAEIIKHACIKDAGMFKMLEQYKLADFQKDKKLLNKLIQRNALLKSKVVQHDEFEQGDRKLLNFGHTLGHAIENTYQLPHGHAVTIGMVVASYISRDMLGLKDADRIAFLIVKYGLTAFFKFDANKALDIMKADKKATGNDIQYVLLEKIGKGVVKPLTINQVAPVVQQLATTN